MAGGPKRTPMERFLEKTERTDGCWLWKGYTGGTGYGVMLVRGKYIGAHRFAYEQWKGPIPKGMHLDHLCRVRACVNPGHLEVVTPRINAQRGDGGKHWAAKTHCPRGHPYSPENTYFTPKGGRACKECRRIRARAADKLKSHTHQHCGMTPETCTNPRCGMTGGAYRAARTECVHGHAYTPENTYRNAKGVRFCRACTNERARRKRAQKRAKEKIWTGPEG